MTEQSKRREWRVPVQNLDWYEMPKDPEFVDVVELRPDEVIIDRSLVERVVYSLKGETPLANVNQLIDQLEQALISSVD